MKQKRCAFHQNEYLVNFCRNSQCLLPMCPTCVKVHSAQHVRLNTHGFYDCISDMHMEVAGTLQTTLKSIISSGNQLKQMYNGRQTEKTILKQKLKEMRMRIIDTINKYIDGLQEDVVNQACSLQSQVVQQFSQIDSKIQKIAHETQSEIESLNNQKSCIKSIINHISSNMPAYYNYHINEIVEKINEVKTTQINIQKEFKPNQMKDLLKFIGQSYHLIFIQPLKRRSMKKIGLRDSNSSKFSRQISTQGSNKKVL